MNASIRLVWILAGLLIASGASADSVRCGSKLITEGDPIEKVREYCGEPTETQRTWMTRQPRFEYGGQEIPFEGSEDVPVELCTYDFGPNKRVRRIRFIAGKVDSIETREHGNDR
ncbi:MAG: DUF2845 domain-containing protein [Proteobacteria bacterium]|nr:DUF2845 domain-containing protein [Pseudomonadota bacterium]